MAYTLNTSHPLYGNLIELIGVQSGALVSHKTARTFTKHADATFGTGTYGEHFRTVNGGYTVKGATFSPSLVRDTYTNPNYSIVLVFNGREANGTANVAFLNNNGGTYTFSSPTWNSSGSAGIATTYTNSMVSGTALGTGAFMVTTTRTEGTGNVKLYVGSTLAGTANAEAWNANTAVNCLGGYDGQGALGGDLVWAAIFDKVLSAAEITDLYNSLGANNAFGLVESAAGSNGTATGTPDSLDLIAPTATGNGTGSGTTNGSASGTPSSASLSAPSATGTGTTAGNGTITTPALKNNTGTVLASISGWTVNVYNASTGALVVQKTGLATNASGILTITDAAIVSGTSYTYEPVHATYGRRLPTGTAS